MPDTPTPRLGLVRPLTSENYDVSIMNGNSVKIDEATANAKVVTSGTRPSTPAVGDMIIETDTKKIQICDSTGPVVWTHVGSALGGVSLNTGTQLNYGNSNSGAPIAIMSGSSGAQVFSSRVTSDIASRLFIDSNGRIDWGSGAATADINMFRNGVGQLKIVGDLVARSFTEDNGALTFSQAQPTLGSTSSTGYTETLTDGTPCAFTFRAPRSGRVKIFNTCWVDNTVATVRSYCSFIVRNGGTIGSGTTVLDGNDAKACIVLGTADSRLTVMTFLSGLVENNQYNIRQRFRVDGAGTGSFLEKELTVEPVIL